MKLNAARSTEACAAADELNPARQIKDTVVNAVILNLVITLAMN